MCKLFHTPNQGWESLEKPKYDIVMILRYVAYRDIIFCDFSQVYIKPKKVNLCLYLCMRHINILFPLFVVKRRHERRSINFFRLCLGSFSFYQISRVYTFAVLTSLASERLAPSNRLWWQFFLSSIGRKDEHNVNRTMQCAIGEKSERPRCNPGKPGQTVSHRLWRCGQEYPQLRLTPG